MHWTNFSASWIIYIGFVIFRFYLPRIFPCSYLLCTYSHYFISDNFLFIHSFPGCIPTSHHYRFWSSEPIYVLLGSYILVLGCLDYIFQIFFLIPLCCGLIFNVSISKTDIKSSYDKTDDSEKNSTKCLLRN